VQVAFATAGNLAALKDCIDVLADDGRAVMFGVNRDADELAVPLCRFRRRNLSLINSFCADRDSGGRDRAAAGPRDRAADLAPLPACRRRSGL